ncbi:MAG: arylsulfotransferase family protein [Candidatus Hydrogenedentes bacterium]|nr:arylsulfotransferase family protein [Candidatus Hydrogenedentota bacterium]
MCFTGCNPRNASSDTANTPSGRWRVSANSVADAPPDSADKEMMDQVLAMGYLQGSRNASSRTGVTIHDTDRAEAGLNLVMSGHKPGAAIMDMQGAVLHEWALTFSEVWPNRPFVPDSPGQQFWRRVHLYPDGSLLALFEDYGLFKIDAASRVLWTRPERYHHHLCVTQDGTIYTLERREVERNEVSPLPLIWEDFVTRLTPGGEVIDSISLLECVLNSPFAPMLDRIDTTERDIFHTNTIEVLDGKFSGLLPAFSAGRILVSFSLINTIAVIDLEQRRVVWALSDLWRFQHQPTMLENGNLLVFDNQGRTRQSRVLEISPATQQIVWQYEGTPETPFFTLTCGSSQRLANGNTLITESDEGRAIEVAPDGGIVWEYLNPHRAGEHNELVATLFEVVRLPVDFPTPWMSTPAK